MKKPITVSWQIYKQFIYVILAIASLMLVLLLIELISREFLFTETAFILLGLFILDFILSILMILLCFVGKIIIESDKLIKISIFGKRKNFFYNDILINFNGIVIDVSNVEGKVLFRVSTLMENSLSIVDEYYQFMNANEKANNDVISDKVTPNCYIRNFGWFFSIFGAIVTLLPFVYSYFNEWDTYLFIIVVIGLLMSILGVALLIHYLTFKISLYKDSLFVKKKKYMIKDLDLKSTLNTISIYYQSQKIGFVNKNFYNNYEILYRIKQQEK